MTRGAASPAGNQPSTRFDGDRRAERGRRAAREEEREEDEQDEHEHRARPSSCRARRRSASSSRYEVATGPPSRLPVERVRRLQCGARDVGDRDEPGHARQARREQPVVAAADHGDRVAAVVRRRGRGRQADDDRRPVRGNLVRLLDVDQHDVARPRQPRVVEDPAHHPRERGGLARARPGVRDHRGRPRPRLRAAAGRRASARARRTTRKTCRWWPAKSSEILAAALPESTSASAHASSRGANRLHESEVRRAATRTVAPNAPAIPSTQLAGAGEEGDAAGGRGGVGREPDEARDPEHEPDGGLDRVEGDPGGEPVREARCRAPGAPSRSRRR